MPQFEIAVIRDRAAAKLEQAGVEARDARTVVDHMLTADLWGRESHGLSLRLPHMIRLAEKGVGRGRPRIVQDSGAIVVVDSGGSFGYVAGLECADLLVERVRDHDLAAVALRGACHTGVIGYYLARVARAGVVALGFADCSPLMAPWGGARALLGTNPLTFAFPAEPDPVLVDLATSEVSYGEVMRCEKACEQLPPGCALDAKGRPTRDPTAARKGALLPFGGHKGGALGLAVQLLTGVLTGGPPVPPPGKDYSLLFLGIARGAFAGDEGYDRSVAQLIEAYLAVPPQEGHQMRVPGWRRFEARRQTEAAPLSIPEELAQLLGLAG